MKIKYVVFALMFTSLQGMKKEVEESKSEMAQGQTAEELHAKEVAEFKKEVADLSKVLKEKLTDPNTSDQERLSIRFSLLAFLMSGFSK